jgi:hypothetical protein
MAEDLIRYDILAQDALRGVVRKVLSEVARTGLPGEHHFFISFATRAPGVRISSRLLAQYPEEMTIVLQHQYWDLSATDTAFEVGLSFNDVPERLLVPFAAIKGFADPSVQFGLQFEVVTQAPVADAAPTETPAAEAAATPEAEAPTPLPLPAETAATPLPAPAAAAAKISEDGEAEETEEERTEAEVVSLDAFRKK